MLVSENEWYENYIQPNGRLGYAGIPNHAARHYHEDFGGVIEMTFDAGGWRRVPGPTADRVEPRPIVFVGCSFVFGVGVKDDETFPARLARAAWPGYRVRSLALPGYGTSHVYRIVEDFFERGEKPQSVIYGMIRDHLRRSYLAKSYHESIRQRFPHFEPLPGGGMKYLGMADPDEGNWEDGPELEEAQLRLGIALVKGLASLCAAHEVPFVLLTLDRVDPTLLEEVSGTKNLWRVDAMADAAERYPREGHPTASAHEAIARKVASSPILSEATGRTDLHRPNAIAPPTP